uniref:Uncharacterized protein n=1 Tax=Amphora coffeiformis TaxID=265554 RepID=A0A7S3PDJ5_9STRA|mmetsp:Transcript_3673/g.7329  ORF Transcript_3673/g.7329 Transcript_3673/m.7329 type:complete len:208 (+) Transcript_3673:95-718(+)|eukprot:scaffold1465_cov179-Amphora_coffeaeformis.AAC.8
MVKAFTSAAPHLGMMAPPPVLWQSSLPYYIQHRGAFPKGAVLSVSSQATRTVQAKRNDRFIIKPLSPPPTMVVPRMVVAVEDKPFSDDDDQSLSDTSSCKDSVSMASHCNSTEQCKASIPCKRQLASPTLSVKLLVPAGKPLRAKPRLVKYNEFSKTHAKASVPLKSAISKASVLKRSGLSQDEKLFVEAAATLAQSAAATTSFSSV